MGKFEGDELVDAGSAGSLDLEAQIGERHATVVDVAPAAQAVAAGQLMIYPQIILEVMVIDLAVLAGDNISQPGEAREDFGPSRTCSSREIASAPNCLPPL